MTGRLDEVEIEVEATEMYEAAFSKHADDKARNYFLQLTGDERTKYLFGWIEDHPSAIEPD